MTGPEHYTEAEQCLESSIHCAIEDRDSQLAEAQVHATLALAAATAMAALNCDGRPYGMSKVDFDAWDRVAGEPGG